MGFGTVRALGNPSLFAEGGFFIRRGYQDRGLSQRLRTYRTCTAATIMMLVIPITAGLSVNYWSFLPFMWFAACFTPAILYLRWRSFEKLSGAIEGFVLVMIMAVPILVLSYAAMRLHFTLADTELATWDAALGLKATSVVSAVGDVPWLAHLLGFAYGSFSIQIIALPALLSLAGRPLRAYWFVEAFFLTCAVAIAISTFFPAIGSYSHFAVDPKALGAINPVFGYHFLDSFNAVRDDPDFTLSLGAASGIITFPSIHASTALLCAFAAWPVKPLRIPFAVLNILMVLSAVTNGAHYVVDTLAGCLVALVVIRLHRPLLAANSRIAAAPAAAA